MLYVVIGMFETFEERGEKEREGRGEGGRERGKEGEREKGRGREREGGRGRERGKGKDIIYNCHFLVPSECPQEDHRQG